MVKWLQAAYQRHQLVRLGMQCSVRVEAAAVRQILDPSACAAAVSESLKLFTACKARSAPGFLASLAWPS